MRLLSRSMPSRFWMALCAVPCLALLTVGSLHLWAQQRGVIIPPSSARGNIDIDPLDNPDIYSTGNFTGPMEERRLQALNAQRQKDMVAETNRLVKMAADLNAQINSQQKTQITPQQLRQLAEIEKLAHSIRDKMSTSVRNPAPMDSPGILPPEIR